MVTNKAAVQQDEESQIDAALIALTTGLFRDVADQDYISARLLYKSTLIQQSFWYTQQAIEKYLKGILLFNKIKLPKGKEYLGHDIVKASIFCAQKVSCFNITDSAKNLIKEINRLGPYRYGEVSWHSADNILHKIDMTIWEIRRYCQSFDYKKQMLDGTYLLGEIVEPEIINSSNFKHPNKYKIIGGLLERVEKCQTGPLYNALTVDNSFFSDALSCELEPLTQSIASNSPFRSLLVDPKLGKRALNRLKDYAYIGEDVWKAYDKELDDSMNLRPAS